MARYDLMHWSQRVRDQQAAQQQQPAPYIAPSAYERRPSKPRAPRRQPPKPVPNPDADHVLRLCQEGRLYELGRWIADGKSIAMPADYKKKSPLRIALQSGFHRLIELLLKHETHQAAKNAVLIEACRERQLGAVELALHYGADPRAVTLLDALLAWDRQIVALLLERGADAVTDYPFARAFQMHIRTALGSYLDCKRQRPELAEALQQQADMALRQACSDGNQKWVSLLLWVGADSRTKGLAIEDVDEPAIANDPESHRTALEEACSAGHVEIVKRLKPDPARDDLNALLRSASTFAKRDVIVYLLTLNANPNDKENGGSSALDGCLKYLHWEDSYHFFDRKTVPASSLTKSRSTIRLLIERGAQWRPDARIIADVRKVLYHIDPEVITEVVERLRFHHACDEAVLHELLRTPKMQELLRAHRQSNLDTRVPRPRARRSQRSETPESARLTASAAHYLSRYNRERLYEEVWTAPTQQIALQYGVTDVALAKACKHLKVPKPPRGYWAKKEAGIRVPAKPALPALPGLRPKE